MNLTSRWRPWTGLALGASALTFTVACNGLPTASVAGSPPAAGQAGAPVVVTCEPHQRTLVRPAVVNGASVSQVECVAATAIAGETSVRPAPVAAAPVSDISYAPARRVYRSEDLGDARVVPVSAGAARPVRASQVIYDERPVKRPRSVKKSAVIIGSSAGVGAGVGAAAGGKKGALIGAAVGGGGAAIWDQITRR
jgi:hypothetical protein